MSSRSYNRERFRLRLNDPRFHANILSESVKNPLQMLASCQQYDLPAVSLREFFHVYKQIITRFFSFNLEVICTWVFQKFEIALAEASSCNFSFLKNSHVQINSKWNSKPYDYLYKTKHDNLVLSSGFIMWIGHRKELLLYSTEAAPT